MNARPLAIVTICLATGCALGAGVDLELRAPKSQLVVFEPADLRLVLINRGKEALSVAAAIEAGAQVRIERPEGWADCRSSLSVTPGVGSLEWRRVAPGGELALSLRPFTCPGVDEVNGSSFKDWTEVPGRYRLQVEYRLVAPAQSGDSTTPTDAVGGTLRSNPVSVEVRPANGVDAEALKWAAENHHNPLDVAVANHFPDSTYAGIILWRYVAPALPDPEKVKTQLARGEFPEERLVPDAGAPDGWSRRAGRELAQWQIVTGERILAQQPGFAYSRPMRLSMALARMASAKHQQGLSELRALGKDNTTPEGQWAERYLATKN